MKFIARRFYAGMMVGAVAWVLSLGRADDGTLVLRSDGTNWQGQVQGDKDDEWRFQASADLTHWTNAYALGTTFSDATNMWSAVTDGFGQSMNYYRAVQTTGLFDRSVLRTFNLTFPQSNWQSLLTANKTSGSNLLGNLEINGRTYNGVGVRYRGNTSYQMGGTKKSMNIEINYTNADAKLRGYDTVNLNNAAGDETIMREAVYFNTMRKYAVCPRGSMARINVNGAYWGVYSFVQQQDGDMVDEWFPSNDGDRWRAPNAAGMQAAAPGGGGFPGGGGVPGGGGGFASGTSALLFLGTNLATYKSNYELKSDNSTNAWERLYHAIVVLNNAATNVFRDQVEDVLAVDRWLWFLAAEIVFADDDSYFNKGADYMFYYEPESGRIHPMEHDGNESFVAGDVQLSPVIGTGNTNRPVLNRLLAVPELRQRYLAHMRTILQESFNPTAIYPVIEQFKAMSVADIIADTKKNFTMAAYTNDLTALKSFIQQRYTYLTNHAELRPVAPTITAVFDPPAKPSANEAGIVTAQVQAYANEGIDSVWLYHRGKSYGRFTTTQMFDDGAHGDGAAGDGLYGAATASYPSGTKVRYYVEARSANTAKAASFAPARAEEDTYSYRVAITSAPNTPVIINELMADNVATLADPQGEFDDWIELHNVTDSDVDLTGRYLTDEPNSPRKWAFPAGTKIPANGYLLVWADENGSATEGLHANFKLSASGEEVYLVDTDQNLNVVLDSVKFDEIGADRSYGRTASDPDTFAVLGTPSPGKANP